MTNFTCWHIYGMLNRANKNYEDAKRAFIQALKIDGENVNCLRDLAILQLQLRDFEGHCETRRRMVVSNSKIFNHFTGYITAAFLTKNYTLCCEIWDSILAIYGEKPLETEKIQDLNETFLLRAKIYENMGDAKKGVKFMQKYSKFMIDDTRKNEMFAKLYMLNK